MFRRHMALILAARLHSIGGMRPSGVEAARSPRRGKLVVEESDGADVDRPQSIAAGTEAAAGGEPGKLRRWWQATHSPGTATAAVGGKQGKMRRWWQAEKRSGRIQAETELKEAELKERRERVETELKEAKAKHQKVEKEYHDLVQEAARSSGTEAAAAGDEQGKLKRWWQAEKRSERFQAELEEAQESRERAETELKETTAQHQKVEQEYHDVFQAARSPQFKHSVEEFGGTEASGFLLLSSQSFLQLSSHPQATTADADAVARGATNASSGWRGAPSRRVTGSFTAGKSNGSKTASGSSARSRSSSTSTSARSDSSKSSSSIISSSGQHHGHFSTVENRIDPRSPSPRSLLSNRTDEEPDDQSAGRGPGVEFTNRKAWIVLSFLVLLGLGSVSFLIVHHCCSGWGGYSDALAPESGEDVSMLFQRRHTMSTAPRIGSDATASR